MKHRCLLAKKQKDGAVGHPSKALHLARTLVSCVHADAHETDGRSHQDHLYRRRTGKYREENPRWCKLRGVLLQPWLPARVSTKRRALAGEHRP